MLIQNIYSYQNVMVFFYLEYSYLYVNCDIIQYFMGTYVLCGRNVYMQEYMPLKISMGR